MASTTQHGKGMKAASLAAATAAGAVASHCCCKQLSFEKHKLGMPSGFAGPGGCRCWGSHHRCCRDLEHFCPRPTPSAHGLVVASHPRTHVFEGVKRRAKT